MKKTVLVTGAAGFIGFFVSRRLLAEGHTIVGLDNMSDYYDVGLKEARLALLQKNAGFRFVKMDLADRAGIENLFSRETIEQIVHLAAQAGVRYSIDCPEVYIDSNLVGFANILEACRRHQVEHLVYASSSSVYGANTFQPFSIHHNVDHPVSLYAATKKSNELMAHTYAHLYRLPVTGLRFFTVYGPWGRPDMALFLFTKAILTGEPINVFNHGDMKRDFTYIEDIVEGIVRILRQIPEADPTWSSDSPDPARSNAPYRVYNIGSGRPIGLLRFIEILEKALGRRAIKNFLPMQPGDVPATYADVADLIRDVGYRPETKLEDGVRAFVDWYRAYYLS